MTTSCHHRLTAGAAAPNGPLHSRPRTPEILSLPFSRNYANQSLGIILRSQKSSKPFIVEAEGPRGVWNRSDDGNQSEKAGPCLYSVGDQAIGDVAGKSGSSDRAVEINSIGRSRTTSKNRKLEVAVAVAATVILGVGNRVLYKLALVPLKHYPFFLAQLATFGYCFTCHFSFSFSFLVACFAFSCFVCNLVFARIIFTSSAVFYCFSNCTLSLTTLFISLLLLSFLF